MSTDANRAGFIFSCEAGSLEVLAFTGEERLSHLFAFHLQLIQKTPDGVCGALEPLALIGTTASLTLQGAQGERTVHGILEQFVLVSLSTDQIAYEAVLVPSFLRMTLNRNNRIFQQKSTPEILSDVFDAAGFSGRYSFRLMETYPPRDYCVQYQESDWDFVCRLMEEEGIFFYFQHQDTDGLVLGDLPDACQELGSLTFRSDAAQHQLYDESLRRFTRTARVVPTASTLRDYRFKSPDVRLEGSATGDRAYQGGEVYHFPGEFVDQTIGRRLARMRLEEAQHTRQTFSAQGTTRILACGGRFQLTGHPVASYNARYLVVSLTHRGAQSQALEQANAGFISTTLDYQVQVEGIPGEVPFRPPRVTARPQIPGLHSAVVTGPAGETLYTDTWGRIKVQFQWDRTGTLDQNSSCWIRVDQSWAGQAYGKLFNPRIGQEVWVHFLEGDPDRPVIVGRVHNDEQTVPYKLPDKRTISTMKTQTVAGQGYNEWRFEDQAGKEEIFVHGQKDWRILIEHNKDERIGLHKRLQVGRHHTIQIGQNKSERIDQNDTSQVQSDRSQQIGLNEQRTIGILRNQKIGGDDFLNIGANHQLNIGHDYHIRVSDAQEESIGQKYEASAEKCIHYASLDNHLGMEAKTSLRFSCGGSTLELKADGTITLEGSQQLGLKGETQINLKGGILKLN